MRVLIATAGAMTLAAAAAAALALHRPAAAPKVAQAAESAPEDAVPGLVWRSGTATLRLTGNPCPSEDLSRALEGEGVTQPLAYEVTQASRRYVGCWSKDLGGDVVTMEPGRDIGSIPIAWFRKG